MTHWETLNLIGEADRVAATALVHEGLVVSCSRDIALNSGGNALRFMTAHGEASVDTDRARRWREGAATEWIGFSFHGSAVTHLDALSHAFWDGQMYGGIPSSRVNTRRGAASLPVTDLRNGVVARGVLLDVPALRQTKWLDPSTPVLPDELERAEYRQGVSARQGDVVVLNTGHSRRIREGADVPDQSGHAGWHVSCLPWLRDRSVAAIGCDSANDVQPSGYEHVSLTHPIHSIGIGAMGLCLIDNMELVDLAATCSRLGRYEFLIVISPLRLQGATGSPVNPLAMF